MYILRWRVHLCMHALLCMHYTTSSTMEWHCNWTLCLHSDVYRVFGFGLDWTPCSQCRKAFDAILRGKSFVGRSRTGTGKTVAWQFSKKMIQKDIEGPNIQKSKPITRGINLKRLKDNYTYTRCTLSAGVSTFDIKTLHECLAGCDIETYRDIT